jgi:hypothetical protein
VRHPTDISLNTGVDAEHGSYATYNYLVPVGTDTALAAGPVTQADYDDGNADGADFGFVICQSCHRSHASEYLDMLRWSYSDMAAGTDSTNLDIPGCFKCHTGKDQ